MSPVLRSAGGVVLAALLSGAVSPSVAWSRDMDDTLLCTATHVAVVHVDAVRVEPEPCGQALRSQQAALAASWPACA